MRLTTALTALVSAVVAVVAVETYHRFTPSTGGPSRAELQSIIREYLVSHPAVLQEPMAEFEKRQSVAETEKARRAIKDHAQTLFSSPRQVTVGNREGDVTLVEFFDYNCGYCKQALSDLSTLMTNDSKLRVVLKEFPVLGQGSV